jgi:glycosyltransferase involved in cell wall biosynthesis
MNTNKSSKPFVTVLMACYNAEKWLPTSIPSVLNQTYQNFEFIIVNDGSVDESLEIIRNYAVSDPRIVILSKTNSGPGDARNSGIKLSRGEWIAVIDADDIFEPMKLEKQIEEINKNNNLVLIGTGLTIIDELGNRIKTYKYPISNNKLKKNLRTARKFPPHSSIMYKRSAVQKLGGYHTRVSQAEDADLWLRLSDIGELTCLEGSYVQIRKHTGQISHFENGTRQMLDARIATVASWLRHYNQPDPISFDEIEYNNYCLWIKSQLDRDKLFEYLVFKNKFNIILIKLRSELNSVFHLLNFISSNPLRFVRFLDEKIFGEKLPHKLALKWINENRADKKLI